MEETKEPLQPREKGFWIAPITDKPQSIEQEQINMDINKRDKAFIYEMARKELLSSGVITDNMEHDADYMQKQHALAAAHEVSEMCLAKYAELREKYEVASRRVKVSKTEDRQHEAIFSFLNKEKGYHSKTPAMEREANLLQKAMERVKSEARQAGNKENSLQYDIDNYKETFQAKIKNAIRTREPILAEYDKAIDDERHHIGKMTRAVEKLEKEQEKLHHSQVLNKGNQRTPYRELSDRAKRWAAEHPTQNFGRGGASTQPKSKVKLQDLPQNMETYRPDSHVSEYESAILDDGRGGVRYAEPYEVKKDLAHDLQAIDSVANDNVKQRIEIMHDVHTELEQSPEFDLSQDEVYKDLQAKLKQATIEEAKAKTVESEAKSVTQDRSDERARDERALRQSERADRQNDQKSIFNPSKHLYKSGTPEKRQTVKESRAAEAKAKAKEAEATKAREAAEAKRKSIEKALAAHMDKRSKALDAKTYEAAPVLKRYDEAISRQRGAAKSIRAEQRAERDASRTKDTGKNRDHDNDHTFQP